MSYLYPPPEPSPVVVTKDVGGFVSEYRERTEMFRVQNREVRLHECRSACTLALSLPNVCVYPDSTLKFHQAYNEITKETDLGISDELWQSYPQAVRARLGTLTRQYKVLRGAELISLGVRDCNGPRERVLIARAKPVPQPERESGTMLAGLGSALTSLVSPTPSAVVQTRPVGDVPKTPAEPAPAPEPPPRPAEIGTLPDIALETTMDVPLPPPRPPILARADVSLPAFRRPIAGSQRILGAQFVTLASLR